MITVLASMIDATMRLMNSDVHDLQHTTKFGGLGLCFLVCFVPRSLDEPDFVPVTLVVRAVVELDYPVHELLPRAGVDNRTNNEHAHKDRANEHNFVHVILLFVT